MINNSIFVAAVLLALFSCKSDPTAAVKKAEAEFNATRSRDSYEALVTAARNFSKENPDNKADCVKYLSAAAAAAFRFKESQTALRLAADAVSKFGDGQNIAEPMTTLALISRDVTYKEMGTMRFEQPDYDQLNALLKKNLNWLDTALAGMRKRLVVDSTNRVDKELAQRYAFTAEEAASIRADPERSPKLLMEAAEAAIAGENFLKAVSIYDRVGKDWPDSKKAPQAAFMMAFTIENNLNDLPGAKKAYEDFIKKYPNDEFTDDAQAALRNLGKSPEELVKEFEKKLKK